MLILILLGMLLPLDAVAVADAADTAFTLLWYTLSWAGYVKAGRLTDRHAYKHISSSVQRSVSRRLACLPPRPPSACLLPLPSPLPFPLSTLSLSRALSPGCSIRAALFSPRSSPRLSSIVYRLSPIIYPLILVSRFSLCPWAPNP